MRTTTPTRQTRYYHSFGATALALCAAMMFGLCVSDASAQQNRNNTGDPKMTFDLPTRASDYIAAREQVDQARNARVRARTQYRQAYFSVLNELQTDPQYEQAVDAVSEARDAYYTYREELLSQLEGNSEYQEALDKLATIEQQIKQLHEKENPDQQELVALASKQLRWDDRASSMESKLLNNDPKIKELRNQLVEANHQLESIENRLRSKLEGHPQVVDARDRMFDALSDLEDARANAAAAQIEMQMADTLYRDARGDRYPFPRHAYPPYRPYYYGGFDDGEGAELPLREGERIDTGGGAAISPGGGGGGLIDAD